MRIYDKSEMVQATFEYCARVAQVNINRNVDTLSIEFERDDLMMLLDKTGTEKIKGVFGLDPSDGKQSIFLIPIDSNGKSTMGSTSVRGAELWSGDPKLNTIIGNNDTETNSNIDAFYSTFE
ncbi:MAG: hypothetical protein AAF487_12345 [Bacteroidota bacterium]